jgi:PIN domain nuclease of toxin-antitoxin system
MKLLLDTHILLWLADTPERIPKPTLALLSNPLNEIVFSSVNIWEIAIKFALRKPDFRTDPLLVFRRAIAEGLTELPVTSEHGIATAALPPLHRDPFDRILVGQAVAEKMLLLTSDSAVAAYKGPVRLV